MTRAFHPFKPLWLAAILLGLACAAPASAHGDYDGYWRPHHRHHHGGWDRPYYPPVYRPPYYAPPPVYMPVPPRHVPPVGFPPPFYGRPLPSPPFGWR